MRKHKVIIPAIALLLSTVVLPSCKKDDKKSDKTQYMQGTLTYAIPGYLIAGQEVNLEASGITEPLTGLTYRWGTTGFSADSVFGKTVKIYAPIKHGDYSVTLTVKHADYANKVLTKNVTVINPGSPESFSGYITSVDSVTDSRDGKKYGYKKIGKLYWLTSNLNWKGAGKPYNFEEALSEIYGRLYTWNEATGGTAASGLAGGPQGICPQGWRVPTREDWEDLASAIGGASIGFDNSWKGLGERLAANAKLNGNSIWKYSPNNSRANTAGWNALPGGSSSNNFKSFSNVNNFGFWWSASQRDSNNGEYRFIHFDSSDFPYNFGEKSFFGASLRCVKAAN